MDIMIASTVPPVHHTMARLFRALTPPITNRMPVTRMLRTSSKDSPIPTMADRTIKRASVIWPSSSMATLSTGGPPSFRSSSEMPHSVVANCRRRPKGRPINCRPMTRRKSRFPTSLKVSIMQVCLPSAPNNPPVNRWSANS